MADPIRAKLEEAKSALSAAQYVDNKEIKQDGFDAARRLITETLAALDEMEREHEAMQALVFDLQQMWWNELNIDGNDDRVSVMAEHMDQFSELQARASAILGKKGDD